MATIQGLTKDGMLAIAATIDSKVAKAGSTMTGPLVLSGDPTLDLHAATKQYVDTKDATIQGMITSNQETARMYVKNGSTALTKGTPVYITGSNGTNIIVGAAGNGSEATSSKTVGLLETDLDANAMGYVVTAGKCANIDTSGAGTAGDAVWLGPSGTKVYGLSNKPVAPAHMVYLGVVSKKNASTGEIEVRVQNGFELDELHNVSIDSGTLVTGQALTYDESSSLWKNSTPVNALAQLSDVTINSGTLAGGQVIKYDSNATKWVNGAAAGGVTAADTAPDLATSAPGDAWFDTNDATLYVCYVDQDSTKQWVQVQANSALEASILSRVGQLEASNIAQGTLSPNYLINGAFDIWQRGTSGFTSGYFADRWFLNGSNNGARSTDVPNNNFAYSAAAWNASAAYAGITQRLESADAKNLVGKYVTVSGWFKRTGTTNGGTLNINMDYPNALDNYSSTTYVGSVTWASTAPSTSWVRYSATFTMPVPNQAANGIQFSFTHNGSSGNNLGGLWTGLQIEVGTTATSFRRNQNSTQSELATCQRYYQVYGGDPSNIVIGQGCISTGTNAVINIPLLVEMRSAPTFSYGPLSEFRQHVPGVVISTPTFIGLNISSTKLVSVNTTAGSGFTPGHAGRIDSAGVNGKFYFSSEL